jgi:hypothetical protein
MFHLCSLQKNAQRLQLLPPSAEYKPTRVEDSAHLQDAVWNITNHGIKVYESSCAFS